MNQRPAADDADHWRAQCESVARQAGGFLAARFHLPRSVHHKGEIDLVTDADPAAEALIKSSILLACPDAVFLAEESGGAALADSQRAPLWIIDPLDGTTNFAGGIPHYGVSIALMRAERVVAGAVYDPSRDEMFSAQQGGGAFLNGRSIAVNGAQTLREAVVASGFPYERATRPDNNTAEVGAIAPIVRGFRRNGAAALDLCWVAAGRFAAYWEQGIEAWYPAAGALLVVEAGGKVTALDGSPQLAGGRNALATNGLVHAELVAAIQKARASQGFGAIPLFR
jgi:myo-inositol-1(or 4)-monophosphatase